MTSGKKIRIQLILDQSQKEFLDWTAEDEGISVSALIRRIVDQYQRAVVNSQLAKAAEDLYPEYLSNDELTAFRSVDGEDIFETR
ncbi:MAG: ribbon-helix-helix protein, CopG family [Chloroflexota bacterium]